MAEREDTVKLINDLSGLPENQYFVLGSHASKPPSCRVAGKAQVPFVTASPGQC